jgi:hypothetical protein
MNQNSPVDPGYFLRSFLVVAGFYVALFVLLLLGMLLIARIGYPEVYRLWSLPADSRQPFFDAWERNPEILFPAGLCWSLLGLGIVISFLIGMQVAWWAPFSGAGHGVFLAIICIVTFLQISMTEQQVPKWLMVALLITSPTGIVFGSRWGEQLFGRSSAPDSPGDDRDTSHV